VLWANQIESGEMGEALSIWSKLLEERDHMKYLGVVEWTILKWMFKNGMRGFSLNLFDPLQRVAVADFCYHSHELAIL